MAILGSSELIGAGVGVSGGVFINYRGEDSHSYGALLHAELSRRFGPELVFLDSASIPAGADYMEQLLDRVRAARVVLAVIGTRWVAATGPGGGRRIDDPGDWVRRELAAAFTAGVRVIPVLTDDALMPAEEELPTELAVLGRCQYRRLRHRDAAADLAGLAAELMALDTSLAMAAQSVLEGWPVPAQLPAAARYFTGRQEELTRLVRPSRADGGARAVVVSAVDGMAGIGKTALVVVAGHQLAEAGTYPDGTLFVDLHGYSGGALTEPFAALEALLRGLGVPGQQVPADLDARVGLYRSVTTRRRLLIVLDNARAEAQVRPLLPGGGGSLVLITSRRRLSGLDEADHLNLDTLPAQEAGWLFRAVAGAGRELGDESTVAEIVRLCGHLPLAVRIAAARLRTDRSGHVTGAALLAQLRTEQQADRLAALDEGDRSIAAAFAVSYRHLPGRQRRAFVTLGLHPGVDFEPYATAALLDTDPTQASRLLRGLEQVSLLDQPAPGRYRFHALIRDYATTLGHIRPEADRRAALGRLYDHYAITTTCATSLAYPYDAAHNPQPPQPATPTPPMPDPATALSWLETEQPNLLAVAAHAAPHRPQHTTHQSAALHHHLSIRGDYTAAHALHQHALTAAENPSDPAARTTALNNLGHVRYMQGGYDAATDYYTQALQLARAISNHHGELAALNGLGRVHAAQGRHDSAADCFTQALQTARATGDRHSELPALTGLGRVDRLQGRYDAALSSYTQALQTARSTGHSTEELGALNGMGNVYYMQRRYDLAIDCYTAALAIARATGQRGAELGPLVGLGNVHYLQGRYDAAAHCHTDALQTARVTGHRGAELNALNGLGGIHYAQRQYGLAVGYFTQVLDLACEIGDRNWQIEGHLGMGRFYHATGQLDQALAAHQQALDLARDLNQRPDEARAYDGLAHIHHTLGHTEQARQHWQHALAILNTLDTPAAEDLSAADLRARLADLQPILPRHYQ